MRFSSGYRDTNYNEPFVVVAIPKYLHLSSVWLIFRIRTENNDDGTTANVYLNRHNLCIFILGCSCCRSLSSTVALYSAMKIARKVAQKHSKASSDQIEKYIPPTIRSQAKFLPIIMIIINSSTHSFRIICIYSINSWQLNPLDTISSN